MFKKSSNKGFTIVETLIVLAVVATILIIVLLAVPALQRNSRNTQAKSAANTLAAGWAEQVTNGYAGSSGTAPTFTAGSVTINGQAYKIPTGLTVNVNTTTSATVTYAATGGSASSVAPNSLVMVPGGTCPASNSATASTVAGAGNQVAIYYPIEGVNQVGCIQG